MKTEMSAIFSSRDAADLALLRAKERGVRVQHSTINLMAGAPVRALNSLTSYTPLFLPGFAVNSGTTTVTEMPVGFPMVAQPPIGTNDSSGSDLVSEECVLHMEVDERDAAMAKSVLVSNHGRQVR